jgi:hypothetical protein
MYPSPLYIFGRLSRIFVEECGVLFPDQPPMPLVWLRLNRRFYSIFSLKILPIMIMHGKMNMGVITPPIGNSILYSPRKFHHILSHGLKPCDDMMLPSGGRHVSLK